MTLPSRIKDLPQHERPRERLAEHGAEALTDAELIAILLRTGLRGQSAVQVGRALIHRFGTLSEMSRATLEELKEIKKLNLKPFWKELTLEKVRKFRVKSLRLTL